MPGDDEESTTAGTAPRSASTALLTDHYELTALDAALRSGVAHHRATFEVFARRLAAGRRYGVVAGTARVVDAVEAFRFGPDELDWLRARQIVSPPTLDWLASYRFSGDIDGYREGELFFPYSPILTVEGSFGEALVLETVVLSILNHDSAVASAAARMVDAAAGRRLIEAGGRRTHEEAAVAAARAVYMAGFDVSSNLEAGHRFGVPTGGTAMHAFVLAHASERAAFDAQVAAYGPGTTFLVDTYDTPGGVRTAIEACAAVGAIPGAIRIDSGDLAAEAHAARAILDEAGATATGIVVSGDLDERQLEALAGAPVDAYLIGTDVVTGAGAPTAGLVYKLVAVADGPGRDRPQHGVQKRSPAKANTGGRKRAVRLFDAVGRARAERVTRFDEPPGDEGGRPLQVPLVRAGIRVGPGDLDEARRHCARARGELRPEHRRLDPGPPALDATPSEGATR